MNIGRRKLVVGQFLGLHPSDFVATQGHRRTTQEVTLKQVEGDGLGLIVMIDLEQMCGRLHLYGQFFPHLSFKTGFQTLSGFLLAARELPVPSKMAALRPPRDEEFSVFPEQTSRHMKMRFRHDITGVP